MIKLIAERYRTEPTDFPFEKRIYGEDASPEEIQAIKDCTYVLEPGIICVKEIPVVSAFSIQINFDRVLELATFFDNWAYLVDVRRVEAPNAKARRCIHTNFHDIHSKTSHVAFCTAKNSMMNTVLRFVIYNTNLKSFSVHKDLESAIQKTRMKIHG